MRRLGVIGTVLRFAFWLGALWLCVAAGTSAGPTLAEGVATVLNREGGTEVIAALLVGLTVFAVREYVRDRVKAPLVLVPIASLWLAAFAGGACPGDPPQIDAERTHAAIEHASVDQGPSCASAAGPKSDNRKLGCAGEQLILLFDLDPDALRHGLYAGLLTSPLMFAGWLLGKVD